MGGGDSPFFSKPFDYLAIGPDGEALLRCSDGLPTSIGNLNNQPPEEIWNSSVAPIVDLSNLQKFGKGER